MLKLWGRGDRVDMLTGCPVYFCNRTFLTNHVHVVFYDNFTSIFGKM